METAVSPNQSEICNTDCLCAYCDAKAGCENERCERHCDGSSRVKQHCDYFMEIRGGSDSDE